MSLNESSPKQATLFNEPTLCPLRLEVRGIVPSFKNNKMLIVKDPRGRPLRRPLLITKPEFQKAMEQITRDFVSQLLSASQIAGGGTVTAHGKRLLIASCVPADDCWTQIPDVRIKAELCEAGHEGATILIERL